MAQGDRQKKKKKKAETRFFSNTSEDNAFQIWRDKDMLQDKHLF